MMKLRKQHPHTRLHDVVDKPRVVTKHVDYVQYTPNIITNNTHVVQQVTQITQHAIVPPKKEIPHEIEDNKTEVVIIDELPEDSSKFTYVKPYHKKDGTYVKGYMRRK